MRELGRVAALGGMPVTIKGRPCFYPPKADRDAADRQEWNKMGQVPFGLKRVYINGQPISIGAPQYVMVTLPIEFYEAPVAQR